MKLKGNGRRIGQWLGLGIAALAGVVSATQAQKPANCQKVVLSGEVKAGQEWKSGFGEGWVFRVLPIPPGKAGYSGWDLAVDREEPAGFPDALLVATPPYNSINEREVGTTFGLRAQDAIGWNPRSFRFLTDPWAFRESQQLYRSLSRDGQVRLVIPGSAGADNAEGRNKGGSGQETAAADATRRLMELERKSAAGEFRILDSGLAQGISDAAPYAESWALASPKTRHKVEPAASGKASALGELHWMRFSITLWLPEGWRAPRELVAARGACSE